MIEQLLLSILDQLNLNGFIEGEIYKQLLFRRRHIDEDDLGTIKFIMDQLNDKRKLCRSFADLIYKGDGPNE